MNFVAEEVPRLSDDATRAMGSASKPPRSIDYIMSLVNCRHVGYDPRATLYARQAGEEFHHHGRQGDHPSYRLGIGQPEFPFIQSHVLPTKGEYLVLPIPARAALDTRGAVVGSAGIEVAPLRDSGRDSMGPHYRGPRLPTPQGTAKAAGGLRVTVRTCENGGGASVGPSQPQCGSRIVRPASARNRRDAFRRVFLQNVLRDARGDPFRGLLRRIARLVRVARRGFDLSVAQQTTDMGRDSPRARARLA